MPTDISKIISDAAYQAYERRLLHQVRQAAIPHHVAIIMDGNRRFAREIGLGNVLDGHVKGRDKLEEVLEWCLEVGVRILTVYAFSTENLRRPSEEIQHLMHLFAENFRKVGDDERVHRHRIRIHVFGDRELLPTEVIEAIEYAEARTKEYERKSSKRFGMWCATHRRGRWTHTTSTRSSFRSGSTPRTFRTRTWSCARAARRGSRTSSYGSSPIPNCISWTSTGPVSARSTSSVPCDRTRCGSDGTESSHY